MTVSDKINSTIAVYWSWTGLVITGH